MPEKTPIKIPVKAVAQDVEAMVMSEGIYVAGDKHQPGRIVAMISIGGKIFMLKQGKQLNPFMFPPTMFVNGPFLPQANA